MISEFLGIVGWDSASRLSQQLAGKLATGHTDLWVDESGLEAATSEFLKSNGIRANRWSRRRIDRLLSIELSRRVCRLCSERHDVSMTGARLATENEFIVHQFMSPWFLFEEHAGHLRHPEKSWSFWNSRPHKDWVSRLYGHDGLVPDFIEQFESALADWISAGLVKRVSERSDPVRSIRYEVAANGNP